MSMPRGLINPFPNTLKCNIHDACSRIHSNLFAMKVILLKPDTDRTICPGLVDIAYELRENIKKAALNIEINDVYSLCQDIMVSREDVTLNRIEQAQIKLLDVWKSAQNSNEARNQER